MPATREQLDRLEADPLTWKLTLFEKYQTDTTGAVVADGPHHRHFWTWVWAIEPGRRPRPFVGIWPRGGAKSTNAEMGAVALGRHTRHPDGRRAPVRSYLWYISEVQEQADDHVDTIGAMLESEEVATFYPDLARRAVNKYGSSKGWRRNRLRTAAGFTIDAVGLDTAARGVKIEEARPGGLIFDDIDGRHDTAATTAKKKETIKSTLIPAGSEDRVLLFIQNLITPTSIFSQLADGTAGFLTNRILSGPIPALEDMSYHDNGHKTILAGSPTWAGQDLATCQADVDEIGITAFREEAQHEVEAPPGGMFDHLDMAALRIDHADLPPLTRVVCWVDPAVTKRDESDSHAIQIDGIDGPSTTGTIYRLYSWEEKATPLASIKRAITQAAIHGATSVGVETDQGGDTWRTVFTTARNAAEAEARARGDTDLADRIHRQTFREAKAGQGQDPKVHRASLMLADYEKPGRRIRHVLGTHNTLERALARFPKTAPLDLADAAYWAWDDLRNGSEVAGWNPDQDPEHGGEEPADPYAAARQSRWQ
jgi:hypothetical protein